MRRLMRPSVRATKPFILTAIAVLVLGAIRPAHAADPPWLTRLNEYRGMAGLSPFSLSPNMTIGADHFAKYLADRDSTLIRAGRQPAKEDRLQKVNYGEAYSGRTLAEFTSEPIKTRQALRSAEIIDRWIADPIYRLPLLVREPPPISVAYGQSCTPDLCEAALFANDYTLTMFSFGNASRYDSPVLFPPNHSTVSVLSLGHRSPDASPSCEFKAPTGLPITLQLGRWISPKITSGWIAANGKSVQACAIDAASYLNSNAYFEGTLNQFGATVIIPRFPLQPGAKYTVRAVVKDYGAYDWSFWTSAKAVAVP